LSLSIKARRLRLPYLRRRKLQIQREEHRANLTRRKRHLILMFE